MTEEIAATPGWVDQRLDEIFAALPGGLEDAAAREQYAACLAGGKAPGAPSDMLGAEFNGCRTRLHNALTRLGVDDAALAELGRRLESLEAEIAEGS